MKADKDKIFRECEAFFNKNYPNAELSEKNWYIKGVLDAIARVNK